MHLKFYNCSCLIYLYQLVLDNLFAFTKWPIVENVVVKTEKVRAAVLWK